MHAHACVCVCVCVCTRMSIVIIMCANPLAPAYLQVAIKINIGIALNFAGMAKGQEVVDPLTAQQSGRIQVDFKCMPALHQRDHCQCSYNYQLFQLVTLGVTN